MSESTRDTVSRVASIALMIAILIIAAGVSAITAMRWAIQGKEVTVPVLTGKTEGEAAEILEGEQSGRSGCRANDTVRCPAGRIVEQIPPAGSRSEDIEEREGAVVRWAARSTPFRISSDRVCARPS